MNGSAALHELLLHLVPQAGGEAAGQRSQPAPRPGARALRGSRCSHRPSAHPALCGAVTALWRGSPAAPALTGAACGRPPQPSARPQASSRPAPRPAPAAAAPWPPFQKSRSRPWAAQPAIASAWWGGAPQQPSRSRPVPCLAPSAVPRLLRAAARRSAVPAGCGHGAAAAPRRGRLRRTRCPRPPEADVFAAALFLTRARREKSPSPAVGTRRERGSPSSQVSSR